MSKINKYIEFSKDNPFGTQSKMLYHTDRITQYIETGDVFPIFMEINLTDICNMKCSWCIADNRTSNTLNTEILKQFLKDFKDNGGKAVTYTGGGEPTTHKDFIDIVNYSKGLGLELGLMTNGNYKTEYNDVIGRSFRWVRFSVDTVDEENYFNWKKSHGLSNVINNIKILNITDAKVGVNCNVNADMTVDEIKTLIDTTKDHCTYIQFRPIIPRYFNDEHVNLNAPVWEYLNSLEDKSKINLSMDKFKDLQGENELFPFHSCEGHFFSPILDASGDINVCMYHPNDDRFNFGNVNNSKLMDIWNGDKRQKVISFLRSQLNYCNECQVCCKLYELNKFIDFIKYPNPTLDINFL